MGPRASLRWAGALPQVLAWTLLGAAAGLFIVFLERAPGRHRPWSEPNPLVAVYFERLEGRGEVEIALAGPYEARVRIHGGGGPSGRGRDFRGLLRREEDEVIFPPGELRGRSLEVVSLEGAPILVDGRRYRGAIRIRILPRGGIRVVNLLPLEDYLRGVVGAEIGPSSPPAALDAQAIAARTYALASIRHGPLADGTTAQVYGGIGREDPRVDEAVERTRGRALLWRGSPFSAYYHSTCGGRTSDARDVFETKRIPPLGGAECGFCGEGRFFRWEARLPETAAARLAEEIGAGARLFGVRPLDPDGAGRSRQVEVSGDRATVRRAAREFRAAVNRLAGREILRSTLFEDIRVEGGAVLFSGRGWGHGVGLCQTGAIAMARSGRDAESILALYYPGATLAPLFLLP
ncbi:MAG TPA: SpoIID/LytB domain-containing protein [Planctomycetota bacterium]|jgi:stage II sporulation protein D|nr:SpoIID/LytB domain-containing protein [Planctomycetota bacterium]